MFHNQCVCVILYYNDTHTYTLIILLLSSIIIIIIKIKTTFFWIDVVCSLENFSYVDDSKNC